MTELEGPANLIIRLAIPEEAGAIASVLRQAFVEYVHAYAPDAFDATTPTAHQIRERWSEGPVWVTVQATEIVGTVSAVPKDGATHIRSMAILPASRGLGIGRLLLHQIEQFALEQGHERALSQHHPDPEPCDPTV